MARPPRYIPNPKYKKPPNRQLDQATQDSLLDQVERIHNDLVDVAKEIYYASTGNRAAGRRARKALQSLMVREKQLRKQLLDDVVNRGKVKTPKPKEEPGDFTGRGFDMKE